MADMHLFGDVGRAHVDDDAPARPGARRAHAFRQQVGDVLTDRLLVHGDIDEAGTCDLNLQAERRTHRTSRTD